MLSIGGTDVILYKDASQMHEPNGALLHGQRLTHGDFMEAGALLYFTNSALWLFARLRYGRFWRNYHGGMRWPIFCWYSVVLARADPSRACKSRSCEFPNEISHKSPIRHIRNKRCLRCKGALNKIDSGDQQRVPGLRACLHSGDEAAGTDP